MKSWPDHSQADEKGYYLTNTSTWSIISTLLDVHQMGMCSPPRPPDILFIAVRYGAGSRRRSAHSGADTSQHQPPGFPPSERESEEAFAMMSNRAGHHHDAGLFVQAVARKAQIKAAHPSDTRNGSK